MKEVKVPDTNLCLIEEDIVLNILKRAFEWDIYCEYGNDLVPAAKEKKIQERIDKFFENYKIVSFDLGGEDNAK